ATSSTTSSAGPWPRGRRSSSPPTTSTEPRPSPVASSPSPAGPPTGPALRRARRPRRWPLFRDAGLVAGKDLRIELRSHVTLQQVLPFAILVLILFGIALDPDRGVLGRASAGLFWVTVLFSALLAIQRAFTLEASDGGRDALRLSGLDPAGIFLGKAAAIAVQLLAIEAVLAVGVVVMYGTEVTGVPLLVATIAAAT